MKTIRLHDPHDFSEWRAAARALLMAGTPPNEVWWEAGHDDLFAQPSDATPVTGRAVGIVPQRFVDLARVALFHSDPLRFGLLYRLLFRLQKDRTLLASRADPDVARLHKLVENLREETRKRSEVRNHPAPPPLSPPKHLV